MSRSQRALSIAERRRRRTSSQANLTDLVGISWKEEQNVRRALYDSLRQTNQQPLQQTKNVSAEARAEEEEEEEEGVEEEGVDGETVDRKRTTSRSAAIIARHRLIVTAARRKLRSARLIHELLVHKIVDGMEEKEEKKKKGKKGEEENMLNRSVSTCPHPRRSRPLPGSLSHRFLLSSSFSRAAFASFPSINNTKLANSVPHSNDVIDRLSSSNVQTKSTMPPSRPLLLRHPQRHTTLRRPRSPIKRYMAATVPPGGSHNGQITTPDTLVPMEGELDDTLEVLVEGEDGEFFSQVVGVQPGAAAKLMAANSKHCFEPSTSSSPIKAISTKEDGYALGDNGGCRQVCISLASDTVPAYLWQDADNNPVNTHDFVDFLCYYDTPCLTKRLSWFAIPPHLRSSCPSIRARHASYPYTRPIVANSKSVTMPKTPPVFSHSVFIARKTASNHTPLYLPHVPFDLLSPSLYSSSQSTANEVHADSTGFVAPDYKPKKTPPPVVPTPKCQIKMRSNQNICIDLTTNSARSKVNVERKLPSTALRHCRDGSFSSRKSSIAEKVETALFIRRSHAKRSPIRGMQTRSSKH